MMLQAGGQAAQDLDSQMFLHDGPEKERFLADPLITHEKLPARSAKAFIAPLNRPTPAHHQYRERLLSLTCVLIQERNSETRA
ncbi:hypothetical protein [Myxococcus xanthus]|uniref:hypothetical protein n=1 Tax=Myxococcus xanthus TaxID=34 RepID=UPI0002F1F537|nr:hypothetical protein [Myxococcus xanthus]